MNFFLEAILYILPAYAANSAALIFGRGIPIDFNKNFLGKPILGKGKTWKGLFTGILFGTALGFAIAFLIPNFLGTNFFLISFLLSIGALVGDMFFSFIKRRVGMKRGQSLPLFDQLDFVFGALLFSSILYMPSVETIIFLLIVTPILHLGTNYIAHKIKIKSEPY